MKKLALVTLLAVGLASVGQAANAADSVPDRDMRSVDHMRIFDNIDGWRPLDRQSLIIWATPFRPYLVKLSVPSHDLRFEQKIGVTSLAGTVHAKFDSVIVNGIRYPISAIYALDRYAARHMQNTA
jgi:hypothetical protein